MRAPILVGLVLALAIVFPLRSQAPDVIIIAGTKTFHAPGCAQTSGYSAGYLRTVSRAALGADYAACTVCQPDRAGTTPVEKPSAQQLAELWSQVDPAERVSIDTGPRTTALYHRRGCPWMNGGNPMTFTRKDAEARYFQPHHECMRKPPLDPATDTLSPGTRGTPQRLVGGGADTTTATPRTTGPKLQDTARQQCAATTKRGTRCSRMAQPGRAYCWQH